LKIINYFILVLFGALMIFAASGFPNRGDANAPLNQPASIAGSPGVANYYIQNSKKDANTDNMVTVILADWRGYDTLGEETVIFTAGMICFMLLRKESLQKSSKKKKRSKQE
jgi:multicomponent Na+:H+ antiporter subunit B